MEYDDAGCDDYDRIARLFLCDLDGSNCNEITRWITPFDRQPHSLTDITPFLATFRENGGQQKVLKFQEGPVLINHVSNHRMVHDTFR